MTKNIHMNFVIVFCCIFMKGGSFFDTITLLKERMINNEKQGT